MSGVGTALAQFLLVAGILAVLHVPVGTYMANVVTSTRHLAPERWLYRLAGIAPDGEQSAGAYTRCVLWFSVLSVFALYILQRTQQWLPLGLDLPAVDPYVALNTAISFVTNTNWQAYSPESTLGHLVQALGLTVQNVVSAAVGIAIAVALARGFGREKSDTIGSFWVDLVRISLRILLPGAFIIALLLLIQGVPQNLFGMREVTTLAGGTQQIPGGLVASQEAIKELGTNGGGFYNANSSHPFENPGTWTNILEILAMLVIPFSLPYTLGVIVKDRRQGVTILAAMALLYTISLTLITACELNGRGTAPELAGGAMEGKEVRFGVVGSTLFGTTSTTTSTGAVNSMHDSLTAHGGLMTLINMQLGEVAPGGVGSGLYGMLILAVLTVFIGGLMIGRTPEYMGKRIGPREMKLATLFILVMPITVLAGVAASFGIPAIREITEASLNNPDGHGLSEVLYAYTSGANNNGSAFAGFNAAPPWFAITIGLAMACGRFLPIIFALALAGSLAKQKRLPEGPGTLPTHGVQFVLLLSGVTVLVSLLTFLPVLALGPIAEGLL